MYDKRHVEFPMKPISQGKYLRGGDVCETTDVITSLYPTHNITRELAVSIERNPIKQQQQ